MSNIKKATELNNYIGRKSKEDLNFPLCFVLLGILTKNCLKFEVYTEFTHRDIADQVNKLFKNLLDLRGWNTNEKELDLKVRIELYKLKELEVVKFIPRKKKDTYSIKATERANELLLHLNSLSYYGAFDDKFKNNFYNSTIRKKNGEYKIEVNFTNEKGTLNSEYQ